MRRQNNPAYNAAWAERVAEYDEKARVALRVARAAAESAAWARIAKEESAIMATEDPETAALCAAAATASNSLAGVTSRAMNKANEEALAVAEGDEPYHAPPNCLTWIAEVGDGPTAFQRACIASPTTP